MNSVADEGAAWDEEADAAQTTPQKGNTSLHIVLWNLCALCAPQDD